MYFRLVHVDTAASQVAQAGGNFYFFIQIFVSTKCFWTNPQVRFKALVSRE